MLYSVVCGMWCGMVRVIECGHVVQYSTCYIVWCVVCVVVCGMCCGMCCGVLFDMVRVCVLKMFYTFRPVRFVG